MLSLSNKLSLTTQPIYKFVNKYSIDFDGVDDCIVTDGADTVAQPTTYSFWCKTSETGRNSVFGHGQDNYGSFSLNESNKPLLWLNNTKYRYWNDISAQDDGEWHHWVVYADTNDITNSKLYVDGVLQTVNTTFDTTTTSPYTTSLIIGGTREAGSNFFNGKIDEFAVYDRELTQAEITRMYNTYYSPNRVANGNFAQIGNEEVTNGDFSQIGSEQIPNNDFSDNSEWQISNASGTTGWTISNGQAIQSTLGASNGRNLQPSTSTGSLVSGKIYKVVIDFAQATENGMRIGELGGSFADFKIIPTGTIGIYTYYRVATFSGRFNIHGGTDTQQVINNVSVKEVGQDWTFETGWSMTDGKAISTGSERLMQSFNHNNKIYQYSFEVSDYVSGNLRFRIGNGATERVVSANGVYTGVMQSAGGLNYIIFGDTGVPISCSVDNISVKEVGQHWTFGTGWSMGDGKVVADGTMTSSDTLLQTFDFVDGATYKFTFTILDYVSGGVYIREPYNGYLDVVSANGTYSFNYVAGLSNNIQFRSDNNFTGSIDNIVVQELKHDATNLMLNAGDYQSANPLITSTKSMEFDGTDDYLSIGSDCPTGNFTVTSWVKKTGTGGWYAIFSAGTQIWFGLNNNGQILAHVGGPNFSTSGAVDINKWHNCTLTWDGTTGIIYVDGVQVASSTSLNNPSATAYDIGKLSTSSQNYFDGLITEVGLYDRALTSLEVASLYNQGVPTNLLVNRNNYQSGNPTVFNTKQIDFDGVDDYLETNKSDYLGTSDFTISGWIKPEDITDNYILGQSEDNNNRWYIRINPSSVLQIFSKSGGVEQVASVSTTTIPNNEWLHFVITADRGANTIIYINGIVDKTVTDTNTSTLNNTGTLRIGNFQFFGTYFDGDISQVGIWNEVLTADEVSSLYNHGLPIDLTTDQAAYASSSNLVGYWRMGSGTLDTYPLIADQTNATLGSEQVTNGDFATNSDWDLGSSWSISSGKANYDAVTTASELRQLMSSIAVGTTVKVQFDILDVEAGKNAFFKLECSGDPEAIFGYTTFSEGTYTYYHTIATAFDRLTFFPLNTSTGGAFSLDNVSVKEVGGNPAIMTNQTSSDIENGSPYANIVQNSDFATDSDWVKQAGWTISGGTANFADTGSGNRNIYQSILTIGKTYKLTYTVLNYVSGSIRNISKPSYIERTANGTYTEIFTPTTYTNLFLNCSTNSQLSIDNVTVEEVNTGLQGYWKMGDGTNDAYPTIYDQTSNTNNATMTNMVEGNITNQYPLTKIRNYYRMGDGILDGYPIIQDQTSPNLAHIPTTNLYLNSEPTSSEGAEGNITYVSYNWGILNFSNAVSFGDNSTIRYRYGATALASTEYTISAFVIMDDLSEPVVSNSSTSGDFSFVIAGSATGSGTINANVSMGNNIWKVSKTGTSGASNLTNNGIVKYTGQSSKGFKVVGWQLEAQSQATAYIKSDGIAAVRKSSTTNLLPYSEDFANWHTANNVTITQDTTETTDPLGTNKADKILVSSASSPKRVFEVITTVSGNVYTGSVYAKKGTTDSIRLLTSSYIYDVTFDLTNLTITETSGNGRIESVGNGWYRLQATGSSSLTTEVPQIELNGSPSINEYLYLWGSQFEEQTQAETYAKTTGLPVTIDLFTENNYGTMTNMSASDIVEDTP